MEYTKLEIKRLLYHWLDIEDVDSRIDLYNAMKCCSFNYEQCTAISLYMCNLASFEIRNILNQHNIILMTPINVLLDDSIAMIENNINNRYEIAHEDKMPLIKSHSIYNVLTNKEKVIFIPDIGIIDGIQYELSKFDGMMKDALESSYQYVEEDIQLRRQEEINNRKRYNFLEYERHYHSVCDIDCIQGV